jgi:hypothetical protein
VGVRGTDFKTEYIAGKPCPGFPTCLRYTPINLERPFDALERSLV